MKLLFYINAIHHGGAERVITNLANHFSDEHDIILVTSFKDTWEYPVDAKVKRINLCTQMPSSFVKRNLELVKRLRKVYKQEKPDVAISFMAEPNFRNILASFGLSNKTIISVRNDPEKEYPNAIFKMAAKTLYPFCDGVVFQTEDAKSWFSQGIQNKSCIIYNPVDSIFYESVHEGARKDIVTTGRLTEQKNHKLLIEAFSKMADATSDRLIIYGDGELDEELKQYAQSLHIADRVILPGATKQVYKDICDAKLFVLSSDYEGMPNSLMEAIAMQIPCVSTDCPCGGPRMLLKGKYLVPIQDVDALAEAMKELLTDDVQNNVASKYCKECAKEFNSEKVFKDWITYIEKIV